MYKTPMGFGADFATSWKSSLFLGDHQDQTRTVRLFLTNVSHSSFLSWSASRVILLSALSNCLRLIVLQKALLLLSLWQHYFLLQAAHFLISSSLKSFIKCLNKNHGCLLSHQCLQFSVFEQSRSSTAIPPPPPHKKLYLSAPLIQHVFSWVCNLLFRRHPAGFLLMATKKLS